MIKENGLKYDSKSMILSNVLNYLNRDIPVILILQAYAGKRLVDWRNNWNDGHYTIAIGHNKNKLIFSDPSSFKRKYLFFDELTDRWHDEDSTGRKYLNRGIAVFGKAPSFKSCELIHLT